MKSIEKYKNIEMVASAEEDGSKIWFKLKVFPIGLTGNDAAAIASKVQHPVSGSIAQMKITNENVFKFALHSLFRNKPIIKEIEKWLDDYNVQEDKQVIMDYFLCKGPLDN